jgi:hypothetical protein
MGVGLFESGTRGKGPPQPFFNAPQPSAKAGEQLPQQVGGACVVGFSSMVSQPNYAGQFHNTRSTGFAGGAARRAKGVG